MTSAVNSGNAVLTKQASASPEVAEVLNAAWPSDQTPMTKVAALATILATGLIVEETQDPYA